MVVAIAGSPAIGGRVGYTLRAPTLAYEVSMSETTDTTATPFAPGDAVTWLRESRAGYGYIERIPGTFVRYTARAAVIVVALRDGTRVSRRVNPANLRRREA